MNELIGRYRQGPEFLESALAGVTEDEANFHRESGKWNIKQTVRHLADTEILAAARFRTIISEDNPVLAGFKPDDWAAGLKYDQAPLAGSLAMFRALRVDNADLLEQSGEAALARTGQHSVRGPMSIQMFVELFLKHVETHVRHIKETREAWSAK